MADTNRPKIGDFVRPGSNPTPKASPSPVETKAEEKAASVDKEAEEEKILAQVESAKKDENEDEVKARLSLYEDMSQALLPVKDYAEFLKKREIDIEKAEAVVDNILMKGYHEETYPLTKRSSVVFRSREHRDTIRLYVALQVQRPIYEDAVSELMMRYNMAASLAELTGPNGRRFSFPNPDDSEEQANKLFDERMKYVERLPSILFAKLSLKLSQFDRMVMSIMREGVTEHF